MPTNPSGTVSGWRSGAEEFIRHVPNEGTTPHRFPEPPSAVAGSVGEAIENIHE